MYEFEAAEDRVYRDENREAALVTQYENYANAMDLSRIGAVSSGISAFEKPFGDFAEQATGQIGANILQG